MPASHVERIAISLPSELLRLIEKLRRARGETRSGLIQKALVRYLDELRRASRLRAYVKGYAAHPETAEEMAVAEAGASSLLAGEPWE